MSGDNKKVIRDTTFHQQEKETESLAEFLQRSLQETFVDHLPLETLKELPTNYMYIFGCMGYAIAVATILYFTYTIYMQQTTKRFIALNYEDGICEPVTTEISGEYLASTQGLWEGRKGFSYSEAIYSFKITNFKNSLDGYKEIMDGISNGLDKVKAGAVHRDAAENLLFWMTWSIASGKTDHFQMTGDPTSILNREYFYGTLGGIKGECDAEPDGSFTVSTAEMELFFAKDKFDLYENCTLAATPEWMGYVQRFMKNNFRVKIDAWQAMVAISINLGTIPMNLLQIVQNTQFTVEFNGELLEFVEVFDFRYPGMLPLTCIINQERDGFRACLLRQGDTYMLPRVSGEMQLVMDYVWFDCFNSISDWDSSNGDVENRECHNLDLMVSVLFYNLPPYDFSNSSAHQLANNSLFAALTLLESDSYYNINRNAYNISYACCRYGQWTDPHWRNSSYEFCTLPGFGSCSIIMYNPYDRRSRTVSPYYYQVPQIACVDSFTIPTWDMLQETPPQPLDEVYLQCTVPWYEAIFEAQGIAAGNAALAVPLLMGLLLPLLFLYMKKTGKSPPKPEYTEEELTKASRAHALFMLRVRDNKTRGFSRNSVLLQTARELMKVSQQEGGYSDSDDESSEEESVVSDKGDSDDEVEDDGQASHVTHSPIFTGPVARAIRHRREKRKSQISQATAGKSVELNSDLKLRPHHTPKLHRVGSLYILNYFKHHKSGLSRRRSLTDCHSLDDFFGVLERLNALFEKAHAVRDKNGGGASFRNARNESLNLKNLDLKSICSCSQANPDEAQDCFSMLRTVMCLHASLEFNRELAGTMDALGRDVAYNIGGRVLSLTDVREIISVGASPLYIGFDMPPV